MATELRVVLMTAPTPALARDMAAVAVTEKLAACANIVPGIVSIYEWEGELTEDQELMIVFKTTVERFPALRDRMLELHPYDLPEVLSLQPDDGHVDYLNWVMTATGSR